MPLLRRLRARRVLVVAIASVAMASCTAAAAQDGPPSFATPVPAYAALVTEAARRFRVPETWLWSVMRAESGGNSHALSPAGAMGLMQIMPATWAMLSARYSLGTDPYAPPANIQAGAAYLREMLDRYGELDTALAAYNAGPGRVDDWRAGARSLPAATPAYVARVTADVGASGMPTVAARPAPSITWRNATLFAARMDRPAARTLAAIIAPTLDRLPASIAQASTPQAPTNPLFVPSAGRGAP